MKIMKLTGDWLIFPHKKAGKLLEGIVFEFYIWNDAHNNYEFKVNSNIKPSIKLK